jgi:hypothetical protein
VSLAAESDVRRHVLTHKHTDLKDRFYAWIKAQNSVPASEAQLREQNARLHARLDDLRGERDEYKQAAEALARALNVLTAENDALRLQASRASRPRPARAPGPGQLTPGGPCRRRQRVPLRTPRPALDLTPGRPVPCGATRLSASPTGGIQGSRVRDLGPRAWPLLRMTSDADPGDRPWALRNVRRRPSCSR